MVITFENENFGEIRVLKPSLDQYLKISDKLEAAYNSSKDNVDLQNDGQTDIAGLVVYPSQKDFYDIWEEFGTLCFKIWSQIKTICGEDFQVTVEKTLVDEVEISVHGKHSGVITVSDTSGKHLGRFVFRKLGRLATSFITKEIQKTGSLSPSSIFKIAKESILTGDNDSSALFEEYPGLAVKIGLEIVGLSSKDVQISIKKA